jgi:type I restriction enzyme S subunit
MPARDLSEPARDTDFVACSRKRSLSELPPVQPNFVSNIPQKFLFCTLREAIQHFQQYASGAVFDAIIVDTFKLIPFLIPDAKLVGLFEETVEPMFQQIENVLLQNQKLRAARDLLLPRLMSGKMAV